MLWSALRRLLEGKNGRLGRDAVFNLPTLGLIMSYETKRPIHIANVVVVYLVVELFILRQCYEQHSA